MNKKTKQPIRTKSKSIPKSKLLKKQTKLSKVDKFNVKEIYDKIGFSENTVICGNCFHRGSLSKKGEYYEIRHRGAENNTCYIGKRPNEEIAHIPVRVVSPTTVG